MDIYRPGPGTGAFLVLKNNKGNVMHAWVDGEVTGQGVLNKLQYRWGLFLIFLAGACVRLYRISDQLVIDDEWHALNAVQYHDFGWIFTHFGDSDHSIPLALLYELQYQVTGLNELLLRWPMLLAGCATVVVLPYMLRFWLTRSERLMLAVLLAISPFLIYYSRFARPYAILVVLESAALLLAWHWWKGNQLKHGLGWVLLATLSAWLNTPALIVVTSPFIWFGLHATHKVIRTRDWSDFLRLCVIAIVMLALLAIFLGPPLYTQPAVIFAKAGRHFIDLETLPWAISLASGSGQTWLYVALFLFSFLGVGVLFRRHKAFTKYIVATALFAILTLIVTGAAFAVHGNIFLRYLIGLLPFYLAFVAIGLVKATSHLVGRSGWPAAMTGVTLLFVVTTLVLAGPIPGWPIRDNQFLSHQNYHFHYNPQRNLYSLAMKDWYQAEPFYEEIAKAHPDSDAIIVEAPWSMESYTNPLNRQQETHHQQVQVGFVNGVCSKPLYGELAAGQPGMKFRNFVYLQELLDGSRSADYLVLRRRTMPDTSRKIEMDFDQCEQAVRARFGEPWRQSELALVFRTNHSD
jgi:hypothetical protein